MIASPQKTKKKGGQQVAITKALVSVWDKTGVEEVCAALVKKGVEILSTGGTLRHLQEKAIPATAMETITGHPEILGGRIKSLSFALAAGLLWRRDRESDEREMEQEGFCSIDMVICNFYPYRWDDHDCEKIDIGGPTMVRAAAKNYPSVVVLTAPAQYREFLSLWNSSTDIACDIDLKQRRRWAQSAFQMTRDYDSSILLGFEQSDEESAEAVTPPFPHLMAGQALRYGENPHQKAWAYQWQKDSPFFVPGPLQGELIQGKALSYNNLLDAQVAWKCTSEVIHCTEGPLNGPRPFAATVVKHQLPTGVALGAKAEEVLRDAWESDVKSAFGSIVAISGVLKAQCALYLKKKFFEVLIVEGIEDEAKHILSSKKDLRIICCPLAASRRGERVWRSVSGGLLLQQEDEALDEEFHCVTGQTLSEERCQLISFGTTVAKHLKSNAVALVGTKQREGHRIFSLFGAGAGRPNRVDAFSPLAIEAARRQEGFVAEESILVSDAFFPFPDVVELAHQQGIVWIVQPGGSKRDDEVIKRACDLGVAMVLTGRRHFRH